MLDYSKKMDKDLKKHVLKTGTTTLGIVCKGGIVVAADKKGTYGGEGGVAYIAGGDQEKIQKVNPDIIVTTAGTASDTRRVIKLIQAELRLKELRTKRKHSIKEAANLFASVAYQNIRQPSMIVPITHFLLAGKDGKKNELYDIAPDGYLQKIERYAATGSGMTHINPILDSEYKTGISLDEGVKLARKCIRASSGRDPGSGEGMDIFLVKPEKIEVLEKKKAVIEYKEIEE
jgi:proteasome beta subunit